MGMGGVRSGRRSLMAMTEECTFVRVFPAWAILMSGWNVRESIVSHKVLREVSIAFMRALIAAATAGVLGFCVFIGLMGCQIPTAKACGLAGWLPNPRLVF